MGDEWESRHVIYFIKGAYKYAMEISFPKQSDEEQIEQLINGIRSSVSVDPEAIHPGVGFIQDVDELTDRNKTMTVRNEKYKYTLQIPEIWTPETDGFADEAWMSYGFPGGSFTIQAEERTGVEDVVKNLEIGYKESGAYDTDYKYAISDVTVFGVPGKKIETRHNVKSGPYEMTEYVFTIDGITYTVTIRLHDAVRTAENVSRTEKAFASLRFGNTE